MHPKKYHRTRIHFSVNEAKLLKLIGNPDYLEGMFDLVSQHLKATFELATVELKTKKRGKLIEAYIPEDHHSKDLDTLALAVDSVIKEVISKIPGFVEMFHIRAEWL
jgi:hypothetical protein